MTSCHTRIMETIIVIIVVIRSRDDWRNRKTSSSARSHVIRIHSRHYNCSQSDENSHIVKFLFIHCMRLRALIQTHKIHLVLLLRNSMLVERQFYYSSLMDRWDGWVNFSVTFFPRKFPVFLNIGTEKGICMPWHSA